MKVGLETEIRSALAANIYVNGPKALERFPVWFVRQIPVARLVHRNSNERINR